MRQQQSPKDEGKKDRPERIEKGLINKSSSEQEPHSSWQDIHRYGEFDIILIVNNSAAK